MVSTVDSSLADAVQANALGENTCRIVVTTPAGKGLIFLRDGGVVDATYGDLAGEPAFCALMNAPAARFVVNSGLTSETRRIQSSFQALMLSAMTQRFENRVPVPRFEPDADLKGDTRPVPADSLPPSLRSAPPTPAARAPMRPPDPVKAPPARRNESRPASPAAAAPRTGRRRGLLALGGLLLPVAVAAGWLATRNRSQPAPPPLPQATPAIPADPIDATALTNPGDAPPKLRAGAAPRSPEPDAAVVPTIVCRILVDEQGRVRDAHIFRSRLDLASFEDAALAAVTTWTFEPARRGGAPVAAWINWPVTFQ